MQNENGQALVSGLILIVIVLFSCAYFLTISKNFLNQFSKAEQESLSLVKETTNYAHILNEIAINNVNIIAAITVAENSLLKTFEYCIYTGFHQPYWNTYSIINEGKSSLAQDTKNNITKIFSSYSLSSARGFYLAKALTEKNKKLLRNLPPNLSQYLIQSSTTQVNCFALDAEKKYYTSPGILNLPVMSKKIYHFYLQQEKTNHCVIEHTVGGMNKFMEFSVPNFLPSEKDRVFNYSQIENLNYGVLFVQYAQKNDFLQTLEFNTSLKIKNKFKITHKFISCPNCSISNGQFLRAFFYPNWAVTEVFSE